MFETVAPEKFSPRSRKLFYETLPLSIALHAAVGAAMVVANVWKVDFPLQSPPMSILYQIAAAPTPPPPPPPPAAAKQQPKPEVTPVRVAQFDNLAPVIIPDVIPVVTNTPVATDAPIVEGVVGGVEGGVEGGVAGGVVEGGVAGGEVGGSVGGTVGGVISGPPNTIVVERDKPLPMLAMSQVYPRYPEEARLKAWEDWVVVRYVIGKNGRVREVKVINPPEHAMFAEAAVNAIKHWRFRPMVKNGEAQEVIHELTVYFKLQQGG